ncbi:Bax inhibitor 1 [Balamuthia mandrillaris]
MSRTFSSKINTQAVLDFSPLNPTVKRHLVYVYTTLFGTLLAGTAGCLAHLVYNVGGLLTLLGGFILIALLAFTPHSPDTVAKRLSFLFLFGFFEGASIGPFVNAILALDPMIVVQALAGSVCIFGCFSGSALLAARRSMLYLGGFLSSALSLSLLLSFVNLFARSEALYSVQIYFGLLLFCGFVMFDTQIMVEKANLGNTDFIWHSLELFLDFVNIFVRIMQILAKNKKRDNK